MSDFPESGSRLSSVEVRDRPEIGWVVGVVVKRTYRVAGDACELDSEQIPLVEVPVVDEDGRLEHDSDRILQRERVDVVVEGSARNPGSGPRFEVGVSIDRDRRSIAVVGDRRLSLGLDGRVQISDPAPVDEVPLSWDHAYGGVDRTLLEKLGDPVAEFVQEMGETLPPEHSYYAYPRNPHGRGYLLEASAEAAESTRMPNLEDPARLLTAADIERSDPEFWPLAPLPATTAWLPYTCFPRGCQAGLPTPIFDRERIRLEDFPEVQNGLVRTRALTKGASIPDRVDVACGQGAAPGMRFDRVRPGDTVSLENVHPSQPVWTFRLPRERPRTAFRLPDHKAEELESKIRSVVIEPDENRVCVVWVGERILEAPLTPEQLARVEYGMKWADR